MEADDFRAQGQSLLPSGRIWTRNPDSLVGGVFLAVGDMLARIDDAAEKLRREMDPGTAQDLLPEWERNLGLPDPCIGTPADIPGRQAVAAQRWAARGGNTLAYFQALARRMHFTATVTRTDPYTFHVAVTAETGAYTHEALECVINRAKRTHALVTFSYPP